MTATRSLREAWAGQIRAEDYDAHMAAVGQAQANAALVAEELTASPPQPGARILLAGAGTGQVLDFVEPSILMPYRLTFTDINPGFLQVLKQRLAKLRGLHIEVQPDDVEDSKLPGTFDLVIAVLVLEHVDWRKAVATLCRLAASRVFIIMQENPANVIVRPLPGTMALLQGIKKDLLGREDVQSEFRNNGFALQHWVSREVPDDKRMVALRFQRLS